MLSPEGWEVWQRNGRVWIAEGHRRVAMLDAAQYGMLVAMCCGPASAHNTVPTRRFLRKLRESCQGQHEMDLNYGVSWSRISWLVFKC